MYSRKPRPVSFAAWDSNTSTPPVRLALNLACLPLRFRNAVTMAGAVPAVVGKHCSLVWEDTSATESEFSQSAETVDARSTVVTDDDAASSKPARTGDAGCRDRRPCVRLDTRFECPHETPPKPKQSDDAIPR